MIALPTNVRVLIATKPVDFRKGMDGLAAIVAAELKLEPFSGIVYVFRAHSGDLDQPFQRISIKRSGRTRSVEYGVRDGSIGLIG